MKIIVDSDSCPVKDIIVKISKNYNLEVIFVVNINHEINISANNIKKILVDNNSQSADIRIANISEGGDIVVTSDHGLAAMVLGKNCYCISFNGYIYNEENIDELMMRRHLTMKLKRSNKINIKGPSKRKEQDDLHFQLNLTKLIEKV